MVWQIAILRILNRQPRRSAGVAGYFGATARIQGNGPQTGAGRLRSADGEPFYRDARSPVAGLASFGQPEIRNLVLPMARNLNADTHFTDARTFTAFSMSRMKWTPVRALVPPATAWVDRW